MSDSSEKMITLLERIARDTKATRDLMTGFVNSMTAAESEIPEALRRFMTYYHDVHDIKYMYEEHGTMPPDWVMVEIRRCDDRYRHLLEDEYSDLGRLEKVRQDMAARQGNRYIHERLLPRSEE